MAVPVLLQAGTDRLPQWTALAPVLVLGITALVLLLIDSVDPDSTDRNLLAGTAAVGSLIALAITGWYVLAGTRVRRDENSWLVERET